MELTSILLAYYVILGPQPGKAEAALATYKYCGAEAALTTYAESYPKDLRVLVANSAIIVSAVLNQRVTYSWSF